MLREFGRDLPIDRDVIVRVTAACGYTFCQQETAQQSKKYTAAKHRELWKRIIDDEKEKKTSGELILLLKCLFPL